MYTVYIQLMFPINYQLWAGQFKGGFWQCHVPGNLWILTTCKSMPIVVNFHGADSINCTFWQILRTCQIVFLESILCWFCKVCCLPYGKLFEIDSVDSATWSSKTMIILACMNVIMYQMNVGVKWSNHVNSKMCR